MRDRTSGLGLTSLCLIDFLASKHYDMFVSYLSANAGSYPLRGAEGHKCKRSEGSTNGDQMIAI